MERTRIAGALRASTLGIAAMLLLSGCAAREHPASASAVRPGESNASTVEKAGNIITQPVRDVGIAETGIPDVLQKANEDPYTLAGLRTCDSLASAIRGLNDALGPDFSAGEEHKESRPGKIVEAGGKTVVNALIPFRGLVREISGAAPAQRRLSAAIDTGFARRGFLRGVYQTRHCRVRGGFDVTPPEDAR